MRLLSFKHQPTDTYHWGVWTDEGVYPLDGVSPFASLYTYIQSKNKKDLETYLQQAKSNPPIPHAEVTILPPYRPHKNIFCVGKNYADHALEMSGGDRSAIPEHPVFFTKAPTSVVGHLQPVQSYPQLTSQLDYEGELAVIIGKTGKDIPEREAMEYVFGYTILNDITARDLQKRHLQFFKGKSLDTHAPFGPFIVPYEFAPNHDQMRVQTFVNDEMRQDGSTAQMIFSIPRLIHILSQGLTLEAGDVIATGTPSGVGQGFNPPRYLKRGDIVRVRIDGIGELINPIE